MHPVLSFALVLVLQLCFPAVIGDCFDDELENNRSFNNCATCYQTLANALINTGDNKYLLSETFFPIDGAPPVQVEVTYVSKTSNLTNAKKWYWLMGGYYLIQPLELLLYRSLFFSTPKWRERSVTLLLPEECFHTYEDELDFNESSADNDKFFRILTQRVRSYCRLCWLKSVDSVFFLAYLSEVVDVYRV